MQVVGAAVHKLKRVHLNVGGCVVHKPSRAWEGLVQRDLRELEVVDGER